MSARIMKRIRKIVCIIAILSITITPVGVGSARAESPSPSQINKATSEFIKCLNALTNDDTGLEGILTRFGGITSGASCAIAILKMTGIIKTESSEQKIMDALSGIKSQLGDIQANLNKMEKELETIQVRQEEIDRRNKASSMLTKWQKFVVDYLDKLETANNEYNDAIHYALKAWWQDAHNESVWVIYTNAEDTSGQKKRSVTFSKASAGAERPGAADNNEEITEYFRIPKEAFDGLPAFDINTYRTSFAQSLGSKIAAGIQDGSLEISAGLKSEYDALDSDKKTAMEQALADDLLDTVIYLEACKAMSTEANAKMVTDILDLYNNFCRDVVGDENGVNATILAMKNTHAFAGEVKTDIKNVCDSMIAMAGYYATFALNAADQCDMRTDAEKDKVRTSFVTAVTQLTAIRDANTNVANNYCYLNNSEITLRNFTDEALMSCGYNFRRIKGTIAFADYYASDWKLYENSNGQKTEATELPAHVGNVEMQLLYNQYRGYKAANGDISFAKYLNRFGTGMPEDYKDKIVTTYNGITSFNLEEGIPMHKVYCSGEYFMYGDMFNINTGNNSDIENKYFRNHEKATGDYFDTTTGELLTNRLFAARTAYQEDHAFWSFDEGALFYAGELVSTSFIHWDRADADRNEYWYTALDQCIFINILSTKPYPPSNELGAINPGNSEELLVSTEASAEVVRDLPQKVASVKVNNRTVTMKLGDTLGITANVLPEDANDKSLNYISDDPDVVYVDDDGNMTAKKTGQAKVEISATDGSHASTSIMVTVIDKPKDISGLTVTIPASCIYTGKALTPAVTVKDGSTKLTKGTHYTVKYTKNTNVGTATVTITGKGKYTDTVTKTFKILPKGTALKTVTAGTKSFTATWTPQNAKMSTSYITGYQIQYSTSKTFATDKKVVSATKYSTKTTTVKNLVKGKTYYVRIRTCKKVNGVNYFSAWSDAKTVKVK